MVTKADDIQNDLDIRPGKNVEEGFQDISGSYPKIKYIERPSTNYASIGGSLVDVSFSGIRSARNNSRISQSGSNIISEPSRGSHSQYPYNSTIETRSGHLIEVDDTPGNQRLHVKHRKGTRVEFLPDGTFVVKSEGDKYEFVAGDSSLVVRGLVTVVVESTADIRVKGDVNLQVDGDFNGIVQGNYNLEVLGNHNVRIHGNEIKSTTGSKLIEVRGNFIERNLSNYRQRTVGTHQSEIGGDWKTTIEGNVSQRAYGELQGSFFGGFLTLNGKNKEGTDGQGIFESDIAYINQTHGINLTLSEDVNCSGDIIISGALDVGGSGRFSGSVHTPTLEGTAKRAQWATTAGSAPDGPSNPVSASPSSPSSPSQKQDSPDSEETVVDVTGTSDAFIKNLDRVSITGHNSRYLNTGEVTAKCRNANMLFNSAWLRDQVDSGAVKDSIVSSNPPKEKRRGADNFLQMGERILGETRLERGVFEKNPGSHLKITSIPKKFLIETVSRSSKLSPNFRVSNLTGSDSLSTPLKGLAGMSALDICRNAQILSYNILEPLRDKYKSTWTITEGFYSLFANEKLDNNSFAKVLAQGLGVGIQILGKSNEEYFNMCQWIRNNLVFDQLILSYIDYDPLELNEPTLLVSIRSGRNRRIVKTEFNHQEVEREILDLSDEQ